VKQRGLFLSLRVLLLAFLITGPVPTPLTHAGTAAPAAPGAVVVTVDTSVDSNEAAYRTCTAAPDDCSLRGAITRANADPGNQYTILLPGGTYTLALAGAGEDANTAGDLDVFNGTVILNGAGASSTVIDAGQLDRVLHIHGTAVVTVTGVALTNGRPPDGAPGSLGSDGGGVYNYGTLKLSHSAVYSNSAGAGGDCSGDSCASGTGGNGGGVLNTGTLEVTHSAVRSNTSGAGGDCGGTYCSPGGGGGGVFNGNANSHLANVTFNGNRADYGGGMVNSNSHSQLANVTFNGNQAYFGGGMFNYASDPHLANVTFSGNHAAAAALGAGEGGGMYNNSSDPQLANVTFSGNHATDSGGGMHNMSGGVGSLPVLDNCILWGNTAGSAGPQIHNAAGTPDINYSLVQGGCPPGSDCDANLLTDDPQFLRDPDPGDGDWTTPGDNDYGDLRLQPTSPAIDKGDNGALPADTLDLDGDGDTSEPLPLDLDGRYRIIGLAVDMGAYEALIRIYLPVVSKSA
jgi:hypothetical protein